MGTHMPYEITQCHLPPGRCDIPTFTPAKAGTRLSDPQRDARLSWPSWLVVGISILKMLTHPSTNRARRGLTSFMQRMQLTTTPRRQPKSFSPQSAFCTFLPFCTFMLLVSVQLYMHTAVCWCLAFLSRKDESRTTPIPSISDSQTMKKNPFKVSLHYRLFCFPYENNQLVHFV